MRLGLPCVVVLTAVIACTGPAVAADNSPPLVDAGVDQTVSPDTTVYLDANGSADPDGTIASVSWTIERPDGSTQTPACQSCRTTEFAVDATGEYVVTLELTDNDGATRSDTLYVTVRTEDSPTVSVSGSDRADRDTETTISADTESGGPSLDMIAWMTNGDVIEKQSISGTTAEPALTHSFSTTGEQQVKAVVYDSLGKRATATHTLTVVKPFTDGTTSGGGGGGGGGGGSPCTDTMPLYNDGNFVGCRTGRDSTYTSDGKKYFVNTNDEPGIQLYDGQKETTYNRNNENLREQRDGTLVLETEPGQSTLDALEQGRSDQTNSGSSVSSGSSTDKNSNQKIDSTENNSGGSPDHNNSGGSYDSNNQNSGEEDDSNSNSNEGSNGGNNDGGGGGFLGGLFGGGNDGGGGLFSGGSNDGGGDSDNNNGGGLFGGLF